jgi:ABC-type uncharacterized transport system permease subunit
MKTSTSWIDYLFRILAIILALIFTTLILFAAGANPLHAYIDILYGAFGTKIYLTNIIVSWLPLFIVTAGLLFTFTAGLWNIGIEGQITLGAIFSTGLLRLLVDTVVPPWLTILLAFFAGMLGGAFWAALVGLLKTYGGVNEIFGGLGLNFVATTLTIWLIFGPWKRPGTGSMSGTEPFEPEFWLPNFAGLRLSPWSILLTLLSFAIIFTLLQNTYFGLKIKSVGKNLRAAFLLGIPTSRYMMYSFLLCGTFAGLAGAIQVIGVYHRLIPSISSGYGFLGLLIAMLTNYSTIWYVPVSFFFAAINIGSIQLPILMKLDSNLSGVLQGALVLFVLIMEGVRQRFSKNFTSKKELNP